MQFIYVHVFICFTMLGKQCLSYYRMIAVSSNQRHTADWCLISTYLLVDTESPGVAIGTEKEGAVKLQLNYFPS